MVLCVLSLPSSAMDGAEERLQRHQMRGWQAALAALPTDERRRVSEAAAQVAAMTPEEQQRLRAGFDRLDSLHRDGWRLGPRVGRHWAGLQPLLGFMSPAEREPMLQLVWSLDEQGLVRLTRLAGRTPPEARAEVRRTLLSLPPEQRGSWLARQAGG